ncbi:prepilin-type N-terminal cleavage/methylation domain-containing protein [Desulfohalobiaceae bacterium Ax17]|uniref:pilus assembly FimT family protein n=1 Tax=Desulfovulcanus ferrireducens TaxID=2831190 RepID=UPI00207B9A0B|nr:prepilin-type N-terminal cleavage/methylation domain-containing protein [Desulfovulcanus ferrireducens]MBT8762451.1 prepilin-type N-terminal cleavage/methylation domain-containing protein [Desulfovulcanus ferrireducens]
MKHRLSHNLIHQAGITFIEMAVVIAIMGILTALAVPNIVSWFPRHRLESAARDLLSNMQKIRLNAVRESKEWAIVFDVPNNRYLICSDKGPDNNWAAHSDNVIQETVNLDDYQSGVGYGHGNAAFDVAHNTTWGDHVTFTNNVAVFNARGLLSGFNGYCYLSNNNNDAVAIGARSSGAIVLRSWNGTDWE